MLDLNQPQALISCRVTVFSFPLSSFLQTCPGLLLLILPLSRIALRGLAPLLAVLIRLDLPTLTLLTPRILTAQIGMHMTGREHGLITSAREQLMNIAVVGEVVARLLTRVMIHFPRFSNRPNRLTHPYA
jgi:hypothetical protein